MRFALRKKGDMWLSLRKGGGRDAACTPQRGGRGKMRFALRKKGEMWLSLRNGGGMRLAPRKEGRGCGLHSIKRGICGLHSVKLGGGGDAACTP